MERLNRSLLLKVFVFQAEDGIRDLVRSRGLGDVYKRQRVECMDALAPAACFRGGGSQSIGSRRVEIPCADACLLYTSDAADERSSVDLGGRRIIKKKTT